jgi:hypothetical protein
VSGEEFEVAKGMAGLDSHLATDALIQEVTEAIARICEQYDVVITEVSINLTLDIEKECWIQDSKVKVEKVWQP